MRLQFGAVNMAARRVCCVGSLMLVSIVSASACIVCDSETGQQVRAGVFDEGFWSTLAAVIAPFPVFIIAIALYNFGLPTFRFRPTDQTATNAPL